MSRPVSFKAGLIILAVLSVLDLLLPLLSDGEHPPIAVALAASVVGLISLVLIVSAWRGATRAMPVLIVLRMLSALSAVPAFMAPDVPAPTVGTAALVVALTLVGVALVVIGPRLSSVTDTR